MSNLKNYTQSFAPISIFLFLLLIWAGNADAQTTISNIPSTDVVAPKGFYTEVNYSGHFDRYHNGGFQTYGLKTIYGLRKNIEIGANFSFTRNGGTSLVEVIPNVKWKAYFNEKHNITISGGAMAFVPAKAEKGSRPSAMLYTNVSKGFDFANGFRLTGGVYTTVGAKSDSGNKKGVMLGYDQPLYKRVSFFADWTSGKNRFGYTGTGLSIPVTKKDVIYTGYNFGNAGRAETIGSTFFTDIPFR